MGTPGVLGSSIISGSGGIADPSMLSSLALSFARRAAIASKLGMFLYPTFRFGASGATGTGSLTVPSGEAVCSLSFSSFSAVRGSPPPSTGAAALVVAVLCCDTLLGAGEADLVLGALTAMESAVDAAVFTLVDDPVRRAKAARRGRGAEVVLA